MQLVRFSFVEEKEILKNLKFYILSVRVLEFVGRTKSLQLQVSSLSVRLSNIYFHIKDGSEVGVRLTMFVCLFNGTLNIDFFSNILTLKVQFIIFVCVRERELGPMVCLQKMFVDAESNNSLNSWNRVDYWKILNALKKTNKQDDLCGCLNGPF